MLDYVVDGLTVMVLYADGVEFDVFATPDELAAFVAALRESTGS